MSISSLQRLVLYSNLLEGSLEENFQALQRDASLATLFWSAIDREPSEVAVKIRIARLACSLLKSSATPQWISSMQLPDYTHEEMVQFVRQGLFKVFQKIEGRDASFWLAIRDEEQNSLLHIALTQKNIPLALLLLEKCPTLLLATNSASKLALDLCTPDDLAPDDLEKIVSFYCEESEKRTEKKARLKSLAYLCYLQDEKWAIAYAKKCQRLQPQDLARETEYNPFKLCASLDKKELGNKLIEALGISPNSISAISLMCAIDAQEMVQYLFQKSPTINIHALGFDIPQFQDGHFFLNGPKFYRYAYLPVISYLIHYGLETELEAYFALLEVKNDVEKATLCLMATVERGQKLPICSKLSTQDLEKLVVELVSISFYRRRQLAQAASSFVEMSIQKVLETDNRLSHRTLQFFLLILPQISNLDLAKKLTSKATCCHYPPKLITDLVINCGQLRIQDEKIAHLKKLLLLPEIAPLLGIFSEKLLIPLIQGDSPYGIELCLWLLTTFPDRCHNGLTYGLLDALLKRYGKEPQMKELLAIAKIVLDTGIDLDVWGHLLLTTDREWHALIPPDFQWKRSHFNNFAFTQPSREGIARFVEIALFLAQENGAQFSKDELTWLINNALNLLYKKEDLPLFVRLQELLDRFKETTQQIFSEMYLDVYVTSLKDHESVIAKLEWLRERCVSTSADAALECLRYIQDPTLKKWVFVNLTKAHTIWDSAGRKRSREKALKKIGALRDFLIDCTAETFSALQSDFRFKKGREDRFIYHSRIYSYTIKESKRKAGTLEISRSKSKFEMEGYYSLQGLIDHIEEDSKQAELKSQEAELQTCDFSLLFGEHHSFLPVDQFFSEERALAVYVKNLPHLKKIEAYYCDLDTGETKIKAFSHGILGVLAQVQEFIQEHEMSVESRKSALEALPGVMVKALTSGKRCSLCLPHPPDMDTDLQDHFTEVVKGIPSLEKAAIIVRKLQARKEARDQLLAKSQVFNIYVAEKVYPRFSSLYDRMSTFFKNPSLAHSFYAYDMKQEKYLLATQDHYSKKLLLSGPSLPGSLEETKDRLSIVREELSGYTLNLEKIRQIAMQPVPQLVHDTQAHIDPNRIIDTLHELQDSPSFKRYQDAHKGITFMALKSGLERFLKNLRTQSFVAYTPADTYEREYKTLWIQFTHTLEELSKEEKHEQLASFVYELGTYGTACGPQISALVQQHYELTFGSIADAREISGIASLLDSVYKRAALEVVESLVGVSLDEKAKRQSIHVLHHLRKILTSHGYPLPEDSRVNQFQDHYSASYGKNDFPERQLTEVFESMLSVQCVKTLQEMQQEGKISRNHNQALLFVESTKQALLEMPELVETSPIQALFSERDAHLKTLRARKKQQELRDMTSYRELDTKLTATTRILKNNINKQIQIKKALDVTPRLMVGGTSQNLASHRAVTLQRELAALSSAQIQHEKTINELTTALQQHPLAALADKLTKCDLEIEECARSYATKISSELGTLAMGHGLLQLDEVTDIPYVTPKGFCFLLKAHSYYLRSQELPRQELVQQLEQEESMFVPDPDFNADVEALWNFDGIIQ